MTDSAKATDWTDTELDLIVADYFAMLAAVLAGTGYSKTEHRAALMARIGRSNGSIEFKHQTIGRPARAWTILDRWLQAESELPRRNRQRNRPGQDRRRRKSRFIRVRIAGAGW